MNEDDRRRYAPLFRTAFAPRVVDDARPDFDAIVRGELEMMAAQSADMAGRGISPTPGLQKMAFTALARTLLGVDRQDPALKRLADLCSVIDYARAWRTTRQRTRRAIAEMSGIVSVLAKNQAGGRSSFVSELAAAAPDALDDPTIVSNLVYMLMTASKDSSGLLVWIVKVLGDHPEWRLRVRNATRIPGQQQNLPGRIVRETLRMNQSEYLQRLIRRDIHVNGFIAPTGWLLRVCVWEGHRDPASFRNPNDFDPDRLLADNYARPSYAPFGASRIWCMGEHFTEVLAETVVTELARVDWDIVSDGPPELGTFHWQPSSGMRISLAPSTAR
jgi:cytochrome P450